MGQRDVVKLLLKYKKPKSIRFISEKMGVQSSNVQSSMTKLMRWGMVKCGYRYGRNKNGGIYRYGVYEVNYESEFIKQA